MNKAELIEAVADATDTSKADASRTLDAVLDSIAGALSKGDSVARVGFGTFNVASIAASSITSGTMADARLPTTMASKTLTGATVTTNYNGLTVSGDGGSNDGQIQLNCSYH